MFRRSLSLFLVLAVLAFLISGLDTEIAAEPADALQNGLVAHWKFDEGRGATTADASGGGNTGTLAKTAWVAGPLKKPNSALGFDGKDAHVDVGSGKSLNLPVEMSAFAWLRFENVSTGKFGQIVYGQAGPNGNGGQYELAVGRGKNVGEVTVLWKDVDVAASKSKLVKDKWYHVGFTRSGARGAWTCRVYIDGALSSETANIATEPGAAQPFALGRPGQTPQMYFHGDIGELRLYNRALSGAEAATLYRTKSGADSEKKADEPKKPRTIAHRGCYRPFPVKASDPKEPIAKKFSLDRSAEYLDSMTRTWTQEAGCVSCHTTFSYLTSRPALKNVASPAMDELREFMDYRVANWKSDKPLWDAEVLITATSLAVHDANTTGKLQPRTRTALEKMWAMQREDGAWNWLKAGTPPFEHDDYYGAVLVAVGVGHAPKDYAASDSAKDGVAKLRQYFAKTPPPSPHHAAWLMWASSKLEGLMTEEQRDQKVKELVALQKPDGGWSLPSLGGWKGDDGGDGYATGLIVFALRQAGLPPDHEPVRKGVQWLEAHQRESGSWFTRSLDTPHKYHLNFMSHAGTAFAVMALKACE